MTDAPSGYRIEQAMATWQAVRSRLLQDDPSLEHDEAALVELLGPAEDDVESILARMLRAARHAKVMADGAAAMMEDLQTRRQRYMARSDSLRGSAFAVMDILGRAKLELPDLTASIRKGTQSVIILDEAAVPNIYVETVRKIDKATVLSVLKAGQEVPGAQLSNGLASLTIRSK